MKDFLSKFTGQLSIEKVWQFLVMMLIVFVIAEIIKPGATELIIQDTIQHQGVQ